MSFHAQHPAGAAVCKAAAIDDCRVYALCRHTPMPKMSDIGKTNALIGFRLWQEEIA